MIKITDLLDLHLKSFNKTTLSHKRKGPDLELK